MTAEQLLSPACATPSIVMAGAGPSALVEELGLCLLAAGFLSAVFERLRVPSIAALLVTGVMLGPNGFGLIRSAHDIETIANLGLTLLLFVIGLEVNPRSLIASGRTLLWAGALQVPLTVGMAYLALWGLSPVLGLSGSYTVLYLALATAFSSTLLVVRALQDLRQLDTVSGRLAVGLLIFQDIWAIIVLAVQPSFESPELTPLALTFLGIALLVVLAGLGARFVLPHVFESVAKTPALVVSVALAWCFAVGLTGRHLTTVTQLLGIESAVSVSMEMGALIAGMTIASFPYHHEVAVKVSNLRDFFVTLFFVALGMSIPVPRSAALLAVALVLALLTVLLRWLVFFPIFYFGGLDRNNSLDAATKLAQISEFCLVIVYIGVKFAHVDENVASVVIFGFVFTALATPFLFGISRTLAERVAPLLSALGFRAPDADGRPSSHGHEAELVVLGYHRMAAALLVDISRQSPELIPGVVVVDVNVRTHAAIAQQGFRVMYGDAGSTETLRHAGVEHARLVISTVPDELLRGTSNEAIVRAVRSVSQECVVFACASRAADVDKLYAAGASYVYMPSAETANGVLEAGLAALDGQLDDYRSTREAATGPLQMRTDLEHQTT